MFSQKLCISDRISNIKHVLTIQFNLDLANTSQGLCTLQSFMQTNLINSFLKKKKLVVCMHSEYWIPLTYGNLVHFSSKGMQIVKISI